MRADDQVADSARAPPRQQRRSVAGEDQDQDQVYGRADRVDRDQDCHLAIERPSQQVSSNGVIDKAADAGRDPADEEHEVLPDEPARAEAREARPGPRRWGASVLGQRFALQVAAGDRLRTLGTCEAVLAGLCARTSMLSTDG